MMDTRLIALLAFCALWCIAAARADAPALAQEAFADGRFTLAATLCEAEGSAEALAYAARARIADAITREDGVCGDCLVQAEQSARAAIKRDPALAEGYTQLAVALGFRGRLLGTRAARSEGLPEQSRAAIDKALELDPKNVWARAALGGWHLEIVDRAGSFFASLLYGANEDDGLSNFEEALATTPASLFVNYQYALSILALDPERFRAKAEQVLADGAKDARADALTRFTRTRAEKLRALLKTGTGKQIIGWVRLYQGYPRRR